MKVELYREVALTRDLSEHALKVGDIAVLVDFVPHPSGGEEGCVLEVFNVIGESLTTIAVPISAVETLRSDEVLSVRPLAKASRSSSLTNPLHLTRLIFSGEPTRSLAAALSGRNV